MGFFVYFLGMCVAMFLRVYFAPLPEKTSKWDSRDSWFILTVILVLFWPLAVPLAGMYVLANKLRERKAK